MNNVHNKIYSDGYLETHTPNGKPSKPYTKNENGFYPHECCKYRVSINEGKETLMGLQEMIKAVCTIDIKKDNIRVTDDITGNALYYWENGDEYCMPFFQDIFERHYKQYKLEQELAKRKSKKV